MHEHDEASESLRFQGLQIGNPKVAQHLPTVQDAEVLETSTASILEQSEYHPVDLVRVRRAEKVRDRKALQRLMAMDIQPEAAVTYLVRFRNGATRLPAVLSWEASMERSNWLSLIGRVWTMFDYLSEYSVDLQRLLDAGEPQVDMMTPEALAMFDGLPETVTVYRGCPASQPIGFSWSLSEQVATRFPSFLRYRVHDPVLVTAEVNKADIVALILDRQELEVVTFKAKVVGSRSLPL